jgi:hypothetical protein
VGTGTDVYLSVSYANFFMGKLEKLIIQSAPHKPLSWFRFIDDVDMKWTESEENLNRFFDHANNVHPTIKFTHETSRNNISFMLAYEGAILVPIAVPLICKKCSPLNVKLLCFSTNVSNWTRHSVGTNQRNSYGNQDGTFIRQHLHGET